LELEKVNQIVAGMPGQTKYQIDAGPLLLKLRNIDEELDDAMESRMEHETSAKVNPVYLDEAAQAEAKAAGILAQASELQNRFVDVLKNIKSAAEIQVQVANWAIRIIAVIFLALAVVSRFCEVEVVEPISGP
jgi:predicted transcriptional regulator